MIRPLLSLASPAGVGGRLSILIFHRVLPQADPLFPDEVDARRFEEVCGWVKSWFNVLSLSEAVLRLFSSDLPSRAMAITFDDGYADNCTVAAPILQRFGLPCTFFVAPGFLDGGCMWNDVIIESIRRTASNSLNLRGLNLAKETIELGSLLQRRASIDSLVSQAKYLPIAQRLALVGALADRAGIEPPKDLMMRTDQVRELRSMGFGIGAHTVSHPILARLGLDEARDEIQSSKRMLENILGEPVDLFAYPNGKPGIDYDARAVELAREAGFSAAVSTSWGASTAQADRFQLPRFTPWDRTPARFGVRLLLNLIRKAEHTK